MATSEHHEDKEPNFVTGQKFRTLYQQSYAGDQQTHKWLPGDRCGGRTGPRRSTGKPVGLMERFTVIAVMVS